MAKTGNKQIEVICHDGRAAVSGHVRSVTDAGCELVSSSRLHGPVFARRCRVVLNLLDVAKGRSENVNARLGGVVRDGGAWVYRVRWQARPGMLD